MHVTLYNAAYWAGFIWFIAVCFYGATNFSNAGGFAFYTIMAVAVAPCALLWIGKRIVTGEWIS